jgi:hypothetical protein
MRIWWKLLGLLDYDKLKMPASYTGIFRDLNVFKLVIDPEIYQ